MIKTCPWRRRACVRHCGRLRTFPKDEQEQPADPQQCEHGHRFVIVTAHIDTNLLGLLNACVEVLRELWVAFELERGQPFERTAIIGDEVVFKIKSARAIDDVAQVVDAAIGALGDFRDAHVHRHAPLIWRDGEQWAAVGDDGGLLDAERHSQRVIAGSRDHKGNAARDDEDCAEPDDVLAFHRPELPPKPRRFKK